MNRLFLILYLFSNISYGCNTSDSTPPQFKNRTIVVSGMYEADKINLSESIRNFIKLRIRPYYPKENDSLTEVFIDTILYNPEKDKIAFIAITKNSNDKLLSGGSVNDYHYNAHCFVANKLESSFEKIHWLSQYNLSNYKNYESASNRIREIHFKEFNKRPKSKLRYNLDDVRFWKEPMWDSQRH